MRFVAATHTTRSRGVNPSSSESSWLRVWSCSLLALSETSARRLPIASSSSMKTTAPPLARRALANSCRTRDAPIPT